MANDSITTVLSIVAWGTNLTFGLYDYSAINDLAPASDDVSSLAKEVNLLSQVLRQIGSTLKEDGTLPSQEAFNTVRSILDQCQDVFREIEILVPLGPSRQNSHDGSSPPSSAGAMSPWKKEVEWTALSQARAKYLLAHMESIKLTTSVMLQTLYTGKAIIWSRYDSTEMAYEVAVVEKSQTEILVIEQQLALLRAYRLYDAFRLRLTDAPLALTQSPQSQALIQRDEYGPNPRALILYQEPTLAQARPSKNDAEDLARVRMISSRYVDVLLSRWTQINVIQERLQLEQRPHGEPRSQKRDTRNWQAPAVEEDSDHEFGDRKKPLKLHLSIEDPVLMHINEPRTVSSPIAVTPRSATLQPPGGPFSPQPSNSWGPTSGGYFAQNKANASRRRVSPGPSPLNSPRASFSGDANKERPPTAFKVDNSSRSPPSRSSSLAPELSSPPKQAIPYRLRINQWYWDYQGDELIGSNQAMSPHKAIKTVSKDTMPITEVFQQYVSREAIRERKYDYTRVTRARPANGGTKEEQCYCIEGALRPDQVARLVEITERIRNPAPRSPRVSRGGPVLASAPQLDRSNTAPVYGNKFRETHASAREYDAPRSYPKSSSASNTSDEDYRGSSQRSKSRSRKDDSDGYDERGSSKTRSARDKEKRRRSSSTGGGKTQTLTKIAAGAGLATLLDGLPEMLSYL